MTYSLITGASGGIGLELPGAVAECGYRAMKKIKPYAYHGLTTKLMNIGVMFAFHRIFHSEETAAVY